ncbi:MAG: hypothetical protein ABWX96_14090 [Propionibacteriaceae bacterium]
MTETERRRRRRVVIWTVLVALALAGVSWAVGVPVIQSLLLATGVTMVGAIALAVSGLDDEILLPPLDETGRNEGARREVSRLSWVMAGQDNRVGDIPYRRLRAIAANRLALRGIDVTEEAGQRAAGELLGQPGYTLLVAEATRTPTQRAFQASIALLERLDERGSATSTPPLMLEPDDERGGASGTPLSGRAS